MNTLTRAAGIYVGEQFTAFKRRHGRLPLRAIAGAELWEALVESVTCVTRLTAGSEVYESAPNQKFKTVTVFKGESGWWIKWVIE